MSYSQKWDKTFGNSYWYESPSDITELYDKGYLLLGNTDNDQGWLIKTDINGVVLWDKYFSTLGLIPILEIVEQDEFGNMYIGGLAKFNETVPTSIIFKLNQCGELQWCKTIYTEDYVNNYIRDIIILNDSTLICLAKHNEPDDENNNYLYNFNSLNGDLRWKKPYASKLDYPLLDQSGGARFYLFDDLFLIAGVCYTAYPNGDSNHYYLHPFFIGIDTLFEEKWVLPFGISDSLGGKAWGAIPLSDSIIMGFGTHKFTAEGEIKNNSLLMFFDYEGNEVGYNTIESSQIGNDIDENQIGDMRWINDTLLFASVVYSKDDDMNHFCDIQTDTSAFVHKVAMVDTNSGGGGISNMLKTFDNKYVVTTGYIENGNGDIYLYKKNSDLEHDTVYSGTFTYDSLCEEQITSGTINLGGCDIITDIKDVPTLEEYNADRNKIHISAIPNPTLSNEVTLKFRNTNVFDNIELKCYNVFGTLMHSDRLFQDSGERKLNVQNWNKGIYFAIVYSNNNIVGRTKFIIQ